MADVAIEIDGLDEFVVDVKNASGDFSDAINKAMTQSVNQIKNTAQNLAPYQTGTLRRSIYTDVQNNGTLGIVAQDPTIAPYGIYVEYGTGIYVGNQRFKGNIPGVGWRWINGQRAQPYFSPAWEQNVEQVKQYFQEAINSVLKEAAGQ